MRNELKKTKEKGRKKEILEEGKTEG